MPIAKRAVPAKAAARKTTRTPLPVAPVPTSTLPEGVYCDALPIEQIGVSPWNPRKTFEEHALADLAESIKKHDIVQPIVVRPAGRYTVRRKKATLAEAFAAEDGGSVAMWQVVYLDPAPGQDPVAGEWHEEADAHAEAAFLNKSATKGKLYELVAGERRFRASQLAGKSTIKAIIRELDDAAMMEIQLIENLQREDLDPLEEAQGFQDVLTRLAWQPDQLAERTGKTKGQIYSALKMLKAPPVAREALQKGETTPAVVQLIGRIPGEAQRQEAAADILGRRWGAPMTVKQAKQYIESHYTIELKGAPFDQADEKLTSVGSCKKCPKRTGNNRELYPDARGDVCTDPACYAVKVKAHGLAQLETASRAGKEVMRNPDRIFHSNGAIKNNSGWQVLDQSCPVDPKYRSYQEALGKDLAKHVVLALDPQGKVRNVAPAKAVEELLNRKFGRSRAPHEGRDVHQEKVQAAVRTRLMELAAERADLKLSVPIGGWPQWLRPLVALLIREFWSEIVRRTEKRRDVDSLLDHVGELDQRKLLPLLVEMAVCKATMSTDLADAVALLDALEIDESAIEKEVRGELKAKAKK